MSRKEMLFVYNPRAGKAQIKNNLAEIIDMFVKAGYLVTTYPTQSAGDAIDVVEHKDDRYDLVVCSGGDGTLDEVVEGMNRTTKRVPVGYIPAGSTNDFANSLQIPKTAKRAAAVICEGNTFACDIGEFNRDTFVYIAAFGLFTDVSYETNQDAKNVLGHMAYILEGMKRLPNVKSFRVKVSYDEVVIEDEFIFGMVTNSISVGGFKSITGKNVELDDGTFEVTLIKMPKTPLDLNMTMAALLDRDIDNNCMYCFNTSKIKFETETPMSWTRDGEFGGEHTKVVIENLNKAIEICVPLGK